ncbi:MAG TPA: ShlB/FhaC/HecB family hemolysin secretion/activation protein [Verrucomicrobiae bacterium]|nr:ShlB/FhaC/HecB family hemolysin secretion/activation protein [Verrucomicrobiae bacterium]
MKHTKLLCLILLPTGLVICMIGILAMSAGAQQEPSPELSTMARVFVRQFIFEGNAVFSSEELSRVVASYTARELSSEELQEARRAITLYYASHGYINSGAVIPEQRVRDGVITIRIVEGKLTKTEVTGNRWLRDDYLQQRLELRAGPPLNVNQLRDGLQLLRQNPNVEQINAELQPGAEPGEAHLLVRVHDQQPFRLGLQVDNARPPSVGAEEILLLAGDRNLTGHSDALDLSYGIAHNGEDGFEFAKLHNFGGAYTFPITARDATLSVFGSKDDFAIIEEPFTLLNVTSESERYGVSLRQPVYRTANRELALGLTFERRLSETFLLGQPFTITPGAVNGETKISVLRLMQEWIDRNQNRVVAIRSTFSFGIDAFGTTDDGTDRDDKFWVWLGQFQCVQRLFDTPSQLIMRTDVQWTDQPLVSLEQFTLGGASNVRGYRENQLVRDRGVYSGVELRVPVLANKIGAPVVQIAPFFDFGGAWNIDADTPEPTTISSAGIGVLLTPNRHLRAQLYWGHAFRDINESGDNLQDSGIHFQVNFEAF